MVRMFGFMILTVWWTFNMISIGEAFPRRQSLETESSLELMTDNSPKSYISDFMSDLNSGDLNREFIEAIMLENELLASLLNAKLGRNSDKVRRRRKRLLKMERNRRSFDSISHVTGGFNGQNFAENPTLRRLRELAALHQQRQSRRTGKQSLPHGAEVLFPILQGRML